MHLIYHINEVIEPSNQSFVVTDQNCPIVSCIPLLDLGIFRIQILPKLVVIPRKHANEVCHHQ